MNCPHCNAPEEEEGAKFCGECGGSMQAPGTNPSADATTDGAAAASAALRCPSCGAGPSAIDADGFCTGCGAQRKKSPRDHFEVIISPTCAGVSDIGKKHHQNEDFISMAAGTDGAHVLVCCDGVSQSQNPQDGSKAGADAARDYVVAQLAAGNTDYQAMVTAAIVEAQTAICKVPFKPGLKDSKGRDIDPAQATIVLCLVLGKKIHFGWAGDSRAYWASPSGVRQITRDDSWADDQVQAGRMTMEEAMKRPEAHAITNSLGALPDGSNPGISPTVMAMNVAEAGRLIICSDGYWNYAEDPKTIEKFIASQPAGVAALTLARAMVDFANNAGGKDNISVIVRQF